MPGPNLGRPRKGKERVEGTSGEKVQVGGGPSLATDCEPRSHRATEPRGLVFRGEHHVPESSAVSNSPSAGAPSQRYGR